MEEIGVIKEKIINFIKIHGPSLPVQLSKEVQLDTMFIGAIFSELIADKRIKITRAKVGGSPLYYIEGQEARLDKLYEYLPGKEKEAYNLLKKNRVLVDTNQEPGIRVALRNLGDFAKTIEKDGVVFWRWYLISEAEAELLLDKIKPKVVQKKIIPKVIEKVKKVIKSVKSDNFLEEVRKFLLNKDVKILEENVVRKNSEIEMKVKVPSNFGDLEFFLKAKNKKRVSDNDLILAHSKGQKSKVPVLFLSSGNLTKKAEKYINEDLKGYMIFRKL